MEFSKFTSTFSLIIVLQALNLLTVNLPSGLVLLASLAISIAYLTYEGTLEITETALSTAVFTATGYVLSIITKNAVKSVCETARAIEGSSLGQALPQQEACRSVLQIWIDLLSSNPVNGWQFWSITLAASIGSIQLYRKINEWRNQE